MEHCLTYLEKWREESQNLSYLTQEEKDKRCLSKQTEFGWKITSKCVFFLFCI